MAQTGQGAAGEAAQVSPGRATDGHLFAVLVRTLDSSPSAVVITNPFGRIEHVNPRFVELTGYTASELPGVHVFILRASPDEPQSPIRDVLAAGGSWRSEFQVRRKNGEELWLSTAISPVRDAQGTIVHLLGIAQDITQYKRAEARAPVAPGSPPDMVLVADLDGTILFIDRTVPGLTREETIGATVFDFVPAEHHDRVRAFMRDVVQTKGSLTYTIPAIGPHGTTAQYVVQVGPIERDARVVALSFITFATNHTIAGEFTPSFAHDEPARARSKRLPELSARELEVVALLARGFTNREVAEHLEVSRRTVDHHVSHILNKLQAPNRTAAVVAAERVGILPIRGTPG